MLQRAKECELEQLIHDVFCYDVTGKILGVEDGKQEYKSCMVADRVNYQIKDE